MLTLLSLCEKIEKLVLTLADIAAWVFILMMVTIVFDVLSRKLGFQIPGFGSTRLQELEWHFHIILFMLWLGANYVRNEHVRVDVAVHKVSSKKRVWVEFIGLILFALPFCSLSVYYSYDFAASSFTQKEVSSAATGLPLRWIIKSILTLGLVLLWLAVLSKIMRCIVYLFGPENLRERAKPLPTKNSSQVAEI